jgi:hypothetical protein
MSGTIIDGKPLKDYLTRQDLNIRINRLEKILMEHNTQDHVNTYLAVYYLKKEFEDILEYEK